MEIAAREVCGDTATAPLWSVHPMPHKLRKFFASPRSETLAVIPTGGCGNEKLGIGSPPARYDIALDLSRLNRVARL